MALFRDDAGKTEEATPGRLAQAANKGQVPMSKELTTAIVLLVVTIVLLNTGHWLIDALSENLRRGLDVAPQRHAITGFEIPGRAGPVSKASLLQELLEPLYRMGPALIWVMGIAFAITLFAAIGQVGLKYRSEALKLKFERLNPASNLSRLFSMTSIFRTVVSALKLIVLGTVLYLVLRARMPTLAMSYGSEFRDTVEYVADTAFMILLVIAMIVLLISVGDLLWQRYDYRQNLKMTKQEVEDERKRSEGDPAVKARLRNAAMSIMRQRMMEAIPEADVVITNPTHFSVALKYDRGKKRAPEVVAKGVDDLAFKIREIAKENDIPLMEDPPLARALFRAVKVGEEIPEKFYKAVAAVLSHVYRLSGQVA